MKKKWCLWQRNEKRNKKSKIVGISAKKNSMKMSEKKNSKVQDHYHYTGKLRGTVV